MCLTVETKGLAKGEREERITNESNVTICERKSLGNLVDHTS